MGCGPTHASRCAIAEALFLDLPYILDSAWRRTEFNANRLFSYRVPANGDPPDLERRSYRLLPAFWLFLITVLFVAYGPTFDALCSVLTKSGMRVLRWVVGVVSIGIACLLAFWVARGGFRRAKARFDDRKIVTALRKQVVQCGIVVGCLAAGAPSAIFGVWHLRNSCSTGCNEVPSAWPARWQFLALITVLIVSYVAAGRRSAPEARSVQQGLTYAILCGLLWFVIAPRHATEALQGPYPHVFGVAAIALGAVAMCSGWLARLQFRSLTSDQTRVFRDNLTTTDLFAPPRVDPDLSGRRILSAAVLGVAYHPLQMLLLPSLVVLIVPSHWMVWAAIVSAMLGWFLLTIGNLSSRWQQMVLSVRRAFLIGTPLVVSAGAITIAILRLQHVQYVSTILDAAPFSAIFVWILMAYAALWWFEYAINGPVSVELLRALGGDHDASEECVRYKLATGIPTNVAATHRVIAPHGAGRLAIMGWLPPTNTNDARATAAFHTFSFVDLFSALTPIGALDTLHDLNRRIQLYFLSVNVLLLGCVLTYAWYFGHGDRNLTVHAMVTTSSTPPTADQFADLGQLLTAANEDGGPAIIVAASGGGTRAALYTASTLQGLARLKVTKDIVLLSGVSGGGVASAYFYSHQRELLADSTGDGRSWQRYLKTMAEPFIEDVLNGASEWRVVSAEPLGVLLAESFQRRLFADGDAVLGANPKLALILNTAIAGHPQEDAQLLQGIFPITPATKAASCARVHRPYSILSGGRLIFTNLGPSEQFPGALSPVPDVRLPYVVVRDPTIPLAAAAALNANFPPVFPNARVDVPADLPLDVPADPQCPMRSYYVTDGGATENLGLLSALYALRSALQTMPLEVRSELRAIHLVAIEASATTYDYTPDRGIGAATGGSKERLAGGLTEELLEDICRLYEPAAPPNRRCQTAHVKVHYLPLPLVFRSRGGIGTHWMFPRTIEVSNPRLPVLPTGLRGFALRIFRPNRLHRQLSEAELTNLWSALYQPVKPFCTSGLFESNANEKAVAEWICGIGGDTPLAEDKQIAAWREVVAEFGSRHPTPP
jgi:hypothetical protein